MLVNAVVKMQWVAPHSLAQPDLRVQQRVWPTAYLAAVNIEALQMHFTFCINDNNNPPARITAREATEQKLNILLEWPELVLQRYCKMLYNSSMAIFCPAYTHHTTGAHSSCLLQVSSFKLTLA